MEDIISSEVAVQCLKTAIRNGNLQMVTHIFTNNVICNDTVAFLSKLALQYNQYIIYYVLTIYLTTAPVSETFYYYCEVEKDKNINIEPAIIVRNHPSMRCFIMDDIFYANNAACFKIIKSVLDDEEAQCLVEDACNNGHISWAKMLFDPNQFKVSVTSICNGYLNVAKWCVANNKYIMSFRYCRHIHEINEAVLLLLDNDLIDHKLFTDKAIKTLITKGYSFPNKRKR